MVEYALLLSLVALALVGTIGGMAGQVGGRFNAISNTLASGGNGGLGPGTTVPNGGNHGNDNSGNPPTNNNGNNPQTGNNNGGNNNGSTGTDTSNNGAIDPSKTPLDKVTPEELDKLSPDAAKNPDKYKDWLGTDLEVPIAGKKYKFFLIGIGQDVKSDGSGKAGFTFMARENIDIYGGSSMIRTLNGPYGYVSTNCYASLETFIINRIDDKDLTKAIKQVSKGYSTYYNISSGIKLSHFNTKMFPIAYSEITGLGTKVYSGQAYTRINEGEQYLYFKQNGISENRRSDLFIGPQALYFWTRSLGNIGSTDSYYQVDSYYDTGTLKGAGDLEIVDSSLTRTVLPCFCI